MLEMQCSPDSINSQRSENQSVAFDPMKVLKELSSNMESDKSYSYEKILKELLEDKCIRVETDKSEMVGYVVEVRVEPYTVIIDFAGAYTFEVPFDGILSIGLASLKDVEAYCQQVYNESKNPTYFNAIKERIERTLS